jgi:5-methylcytosine-specific restriction endonuclease McrA
MTKVSRVGTSRKVVKIVRKRKKAVCNSSRCGITCKKVGNWAEERKIKNYELEKQRVYWYPGTGEDTWETIAESTDANELGKKAESVKLKKGKWFYEKLVINELDEYDDVVNVDQVKSTEETRFTK